ncbi:group I truncated hemoglobin [Halomonas heilongjiangensis]|uniref:Group 1 truncated hemoglobin n=1 Tax=Halomonas heilongjiangensis TaxID=1387883 RepID=A0A2N7TJV0_9GAMM|nr:group 1 truncated hemoglobin [Halomonas heilongjiangensis]PMR68473.1 group 1 truncated hemoglobin [Halomonas heilongjiangensis]PXX86632.1 group 1 truncated hemoglobin [Halomonas heilongjiangensis]
MTSTNLYERLGGERGIASLVDDIVESHMQNPRIRARFLPYREDPDHLEVVKGHLRDFLAAGSGGPVEYRGRSMPEAHRGMNISEAEYMAAIDDILGVLDRHGIDAQTRQEVLGIAYSLKGEIMHV